MVLKWRGTKLWGWDLSYLRDDATPLWDQLWGGGGASVRVAGGSVALSPPPDFAAVLRRYVSNFLAHCQFKKYAMAIKRRQNSAKLPRPTAATPRVDGRFSKKSSSCLVDPMCQLGLTLWWSWRVNPRVTKVFVKKVMLVESLFYLKWFLVFWVWGEQKLF